MSKRTRTPGDLLEVVRTSLERWGVRALSVGLSGGLDSTVLAHLCVDVLGPEHVHLIHVDHQMRSTSAQDAAFCAEVAAMLGASFDGVCVDVSQEASRQAAARTARQHALAASAMSRGHRLVATAHHEDDVFETVLLKMQRGTTTAGLGHLVQEHVPFPGQATLSLLRPLLNISRAALEEYARAKEIQWVEDPTNATDAYARNALRHHVMPVWLEAPALREGLRRTLENLANESSALEVWAHRLFLECCAPGPHVHSVWIDPSALEDVPRAVHVRVMSKVHHKLGISKAWGPRTHAALQKAVTRRTSCDVPRARVCAYGTRLLIEVMASREEPLISRAATPMEWAPGDHGSVRWFAFEIAWGMPNKEDTRWCVEVPVGHTVTIRGPHEAERFPGRTTTIARHLSTMRVPAAAKWAWPCVEIHGEESVWVAGTPQKKKPDGPTVQLRFEQMHSIWKY